MTDGKLHNNHWTSNLFPLICSLHLLKEHPLMMYNLYIGIMLFCSLYNCNYVIFIVLTVLWILPYIYLYGVEQSLLYDSMFLRRGQKRLSSMTKSIVDSFSVKCRILSHGNRKSFSKSITCIPWILTMYMSARYIYSFVFFFGDFIAPQISLCFDVVLFVLDEQKCGCLFETSYLRCIVYSMSKI